MRGFLLTLEALASLLVLLGATLLIMEAGGTHESRVSELAVLMQAEDVAEFVAGAGGIWRVEEKELEAVVEELDACVRVSVDGEEAFRSSCFESRGAGVVVRYFEVRGGKHSVATVEFEKA